MDTIYWPGVANLHPGVNLHREQICTRVQIAHMNTALSCFYKCEKRFLFHDEDYILSIDCFFSPTSLACD